MKGVKSIIYKKNQTFLKEEYFEIEIKNKKNLLKHNNSYFQFQDGIISKKLSDEKVFEFFKKLFSLIDNWKDEYINYNIIDGVEWKLEISFTNGKIKRYIGKNDFPNNFEYLDKIKDELINGG